MVMVYFKHGKLYMNIYLITTPHHTFLATQLYIIVLNDDVRLKKQNSIWIFVFYEINLHYYNSY